MSYSNTELPIVQWNFLQFKAKKGGNTCPQPCFLHSFTQIGGKLLLFGGANDEGDAKDQIFLYDPSTHTWSVPSDSNNWQEDHPGPRYGHTATLIENHPPKILIFGGMLGGGGTFEFDIPQSQTIDDEEPISRPFMFFRRKGKKSNLIEEFDDNVYFLTISSDSWTWTKPLILSSKNSRPLPRGEHSMVKISANEVLMFGGWASKPMNDLWIFNFVDREWKKIQPSGLEPRPRFRHTSEIIGNKVYFLGGSDNNNDIPESYLNILVLNLETLSWEHPEIKGVNPFPRSGHSSTVMGKNTIVIFGGKRTNETFLNDTYLLNVETMVCIKVNAVENRLPRPISNATANLHGNRLYVFGGIEPNNTVTSNDFRFLDLSDYFSQEDITVSQGLTSDYVFKLILIGDSNVGKSSILSRFSDNVFLDTATPTIGIDFNTKLIRIEKKICRLEIWDTAGQERFSTLTSNYYRGSQGVFLVFDLSNKQSFSNVINWYNRARELGGENLIAILIGNKCDIEEDKRAISYNDGLELVQQLPGVIGYYETSALNGNNIENVFVNLAKEIKKDVEARGVIGVKSEFDNIIVIIIINSNFLFFSYRRKFNSNWRC